MDTKKIRIGNDIRLAVDLRQYIGGKILQERNVYTPDAPDEDFLNNNGVVDDVEVYTTSEIVDQIGEGEGMTIYPTNAKLAIRSVKAKLINTTRQDELEEHYKKRSRFISRFPIEPGLQAFHATPYDVCNSGYYSWGAYPRNRYPVYQGYGWNPSFDGLYNPLPMTNDTEYIADVAATAKQHIVEVIFPAEDQIHIGKYKLVLVVQVFAPGYNRRNLKTITIDVPDVFELTKTSEEGVDTGIRVNIAAIQEHLPEGDIYTPYLSDIFVNGISSDGDNITLHRTDASTMTLDIADKTGWYEGD